MPWMILNAFAIPFELVVNIIQQWLADSSRKNEYVILVSLLSLISLGLCIILWNKYVKTQHQPRTVAFNSPYTNSTIELDV